MKLDKHLLNEMLWDGYSLEQIADFFNVEEERVIKTLQPEPMDRANYLLCDALTRNNPQEPQYRAGFSKEELRQSIESLPNKEQRMQKNGFWQDCFCWELLASYKIDASCLAPSFDSLSVLMINKPFSWQCYGFTHKHKEPRKKPVLSTYELEELVEVFSTVMYGITEEQANTVNNIGLSITDYVLYIIQLSLTCADYDTKTSKSSLFTYSRKLYEQSRELT